MNLTPHTLHFIHLKMPFTNFNQKQLFYESQGEGFPLVFVHGFCEDSTMWNVFIPPFAETHQVISIDLPGFGRSAVQEEATIYHFAKAIKKVLDDLKITDCIMVGHSMGGYTTLAFAEYFPEQLSGFCLFHSHPFADTEEKKANRRKTIKFIQRHGNAPFLGQMIPNLFSDNFRKENLDLVAKMIDEATAYPEKGITNALEAMINRPNRANVLEGVNVPVLLIIGKVDSAVAYENSLRMSTLANVTDIQILDEVGHMGMFEAREKTQVLIRDFIEFAIT